MSDLLREQVSAFTDGELPAEECALLLRRVAANAELAECWHLYHLIGDTLKGEFAPAGANALAARVDRVLNPAPLRGLPKTSGRKRWNMRRGGTLAAGVAALGLAGLAGALVMRQMAGGGQVLVTGSEGNAAVASPVRHVDWSQAPRPVQAELNRYLLMHEVYGAGPLTLSAPAVRGAATATAGNGSG